MRLTRSAAKRIAEIDAEFDNEAQHILRQNAPGRLLSLPPELRGLIFSFLFEDEPPKLMGDIYRRSTAMRDPPVLFVCHQLRDELLSYFYSRKAFHFNISFRGDLAKLERWVASIKNIPCKVQYMRKVTFFGRSLGGQASITVDFTKMKIIDARWTQHQNSAGRNPKPIHHHMGVRHCRKLSDAIETALLSELPRSQSRAYRAMVLILEACPGSFGIPQSARTIDCAGRACRLGKESRGPCNCSQLVDLIV